MFQLQNTQRKCKEHVTFSASGNWWKIQHVWSPLNSMFLHVKDIVFAQCLVLGHGRKILTVSWLFHQRTHEAHSLYFKHSPAFKQERKIRSVLPKETEYVLYKCSTKKHFGRSFPFFVTFSAAKHRGKFVSLSSIFHQCSIMVHWPMPPVYDSIYHPKIERLWWSIEYVWLKYQA